MVEVKLKKLKPHIQVLACAPKKAFRIDLINIPIEVVDIFTKTFGKPIKFTGKAGNVVYTYKITTNKFNAIIQVLNDIKKKHIDKRGIKFKIKYVDKIRPFSGYRFVSAEKVVSKYLATRHHILPRPPRVPPLPTKWKGIKLKGKNLIGMSFTIVKSAPKGLINDLKRIGAKTKAERILIRGYIRVKDVKEMNKKVRELRNISRRHDGILLSVKPIYGELLKKRPIPRLSTIP